MGSWLILKSKEGWEVGYYKPIGFIIDGYPENEWYCFDFCIDKMEAIALCARLNGGS